ncbi:MAG: HEAT repeat domain-containing protein [Desulfuromonadaceae bacterium]
MDFYRPTTNQVTLDALGSLYRAVRTWRFYPKGHPTRRNSLILSYAAMLKLLDGNTLLLTCGRTGFCFPDGELLKDASGLTSALAYELFIRRVQKIAILEDLFQEDLLELVKILCMSPEAIQQSGGIETMMALHGIRSVWVNEFDLTVLREKRRTVEQKGTVPQGIDDAETAGDTIPVVEQQSPRPDELSSEQQLRELLEQLAACGDEDVYLALIRQAVACADDLQSNHETHLVFPLIELLAGHADGEERSETMRERAQFAIEQIVTTGEVLQLVLEQTGQDTEVSKMALHAVLKAGGAAAITAAIEQMGRTNSIKARRTLSNMLASLGDAAVPVLLDLMHDSRWFIIRNICAILGSIASREALPALTKSLHHPDLRVKKEAIRSLAQLGGPEAEAAILDVLRGTEPALYPQAIASLGGMKSRKSVAELIRIVLSRDLFLQSLTLKIDALAAIALIGDRQVTPHLVALLEERYLLAAARGKQLKAAAAACLGKLGDARAVPALKKLASDGEELGSACSDALLMIEKTEG